MFPCAPVATVKRYRDAAGTLLVASSTLGYDQANQLTSLVQALGSAGTTKLTYGLDYDVADRLTQLITPEGASDLSLDHQGQLTGASLTSESYGYDATGNRTGGTVVGADNRLGEDALFTYQYDDEGNLTLRTRKDGSGSDTFTWDYRNRLTSVTRRDGQGNVTLTASYAYDGFDRRIRKTVTGSQNLDQQFFYEGLADADVLLVTDGAGNLTLRQLNAPGTNQVLAEDRISGGTTTTRWTLSDHQGSIRDVIENSSAGTVVDHLVYDSFGRIISETNPNERSFATYTGAPTDAETSLIYLHHRYHDPQSGRWLSQDPMGFAAGDVNLYRYVGNSPVMRTDASGLCADDKGWWETFSDWAMGNNPKDAEGKDWVDHLHESMMGYGNAAQGVLQVPGKLLDFMGRMYASEANDLARNGGYLRVAQAAPCPILLRSCVVDAALACDFWVSLSGL